MTDAFETQIAKIIDPDSFEGPHGFAAPERRRAALAKAAAILALHPPVMGEVDPDVRHRLLEVARTLETAKGQAFAINFHQLAHDIRATLSTEQAK